MLKKLAAVATTITFVATALFGGEINANAAEQYGFTYDSNKYTAIFKDGGVTRTYDSYGALIGKMYYTLGKMRSKNKNSNGTYQDILVVRMQMDPQKDVKTKVHGISATVYGVSEYLKMSVNLPTISVNDWSPKNEPSEEKWNIGLNATTSSVGVSASTEITTSQLDYEADIEISKKKASFIYDYLPKKSLSWSSTKNKYVRNSSTQYAMISYNAKSYSSLCFTFNANFTYASDKNACPANVYFGSEKGSSNYTWSFK